MKCPNCGEENPEGMKFCGNCGTKLPEPKNHCPHCNKDWPRTMKFCGECGFKFDGNGTAKSAGISMGDKNVIAGDVIGSKDETHVSGNATIIKNEDETKKTARCHVCGRIVMRIDGFDCPVCGQFTCASCYDIQHGRCKSCMNQSESSKINQYKEAFKNYYSDQRIDLSERRELINLQHKLGLSDDKIKEIEASITKEASTSNSKLTTVEMINIKKAKTLYYIDGNAQEAINLLKPIYAMHKADENILNLYFPILADLDEAQAENEIKQLSFDNLGASLTTFNIAFRKKEYDEAERRLDKLVMLWPENILVKCSQAFFKYGLYKEFHEETFLQEAHELAQDLGNAKTPLEKSYQEKVRNLFKEESDSFDINYSKEYCNEHGLYLQIMNNSPFMTKEELESIKKLRALQDEILKNGGELGTLYELLEVEKTFHNPQIQAYLANNYYMSNNYENAVLYAKKATENNNVDGQLVLGKCYYYGYALEKNVEEGKKLIKEAIAKNNIPAMKEFANICGQEGNIPEKINWYTKVAELGDNEAMSILGELYKNGTSDLNKDYLEAEKWYTKAFENRPNDSISAKYAEYLGDIYKEGGFGLSQDYEKAIEWYTKSSSLGNYNVQSTLESLRSIKSQAQLLIQAEQGDADACYKLGDKYRKGEDVEKNCSEAIKWYTKAAEQGNANAQNALGDMYYNGAEIGHNYTEAVKWYNKAADQGNVAAQYSLGNMYYYRYQNYSEAKKWYTKAAEQGNAEAKNSLIMVQDIPSNNNYKNENVVQNDNKTETITQNNYKTVNVTQNNSNIVTANNNDDVKQLIKKAEKGDRDAKIRLGKLFEYGEGVVQNIPEAIKWYTEADLRMNYHAGYEENIGDVVIELKIAVLYEKLGYYKAALEWYSKAAGGGNHEAARAAKNLEKQGYRI